MKIKLLVSLVILSVFSLLFMNLIPVNANNIYVGNATSDVITLSKTEFDRETDEMVYQKISYETNTYKSNVVTDVDATGAGVDVSSDAQYVFFPARYSKMTESTKVSFKYKNSGVEKIVVHMEYAAGISQGGVDYKSGYKLICVDALDPEASWNVSYSKSADGYDVFSIIFGSYAGEIYDSLLTGFRLYFDYGKTVKELREFEVFGYTVHESAEVPTFASDPKPTRVSKLTSSDVTISNNKFTVEDEATVSAEIYDYVPECYKLNIDMSLNANVNLDLKLDDTSVLHKTYFKGDHNIQIELTEDEYLNLEMKFVGENVTVKINTIEFLTVPYIDEFAGTEYTVEKVEEGIKVSYDYMPSGWYSLNAAIRNYNKDYEYLEISFKVLTDLYMGIYLDDDDLVYHTKYTANEEKTYLIDLSEFALTSSSQLQLYLDSPISGNAGVEGTKSLIIKSCTLKSLKDFPQTEITVNEKYEYSYDGLSHSVTATTNNSTVPTVEYKLDGAPDTAYSTVAPTKVGTYAVRITTPTVMSGDVITFAKTVKYTTLVINKATTEKPELADINVDYKNNKITYDEEIFLVATDANFVNVIKSGSFIKCGTKIYLKYIESDYFFESEVTEVELNQKGAEFTTTINVADEASADVIPTNVEYSIDGINWTSGANEVIHLEANSIYMFRTKATATAFAGDIYYLPVAPRVSNPAELELEDTGMTDVTVKLVENAEYRINDGEWQDSNVFEDLTVREIVKIAMRIKGSNTEYASEEKVIYVKVFIGVVAAPSDSTGGSTGSGTGSSTPEDTEEETLILGANDYLATNYSELYNALQKASTNKEITIYVKGQIALQYDYKLKGKIKFIGLENAEIVLEYNNSKRGFSIEAGVDIKFENIKFTRTVADTTESYPFRLEKNGKVSFTDVTFDIAVNEGGANSSADRVTYVSNGTDMTIYFNNCTFNTEGYFYRGKFVFLNNEKMPVTAADPVIYDLNNLKINYETKKLTIPAGIKVSLDEDFTELLKTGCDLGSNTTYYVSKDDLVFTFTTKAYKHATPTLESVDVDYANEVIKFSSEYMVAKDAEFTQTLTSGDKVTQGMKLYIKRLANTELAESDVLEATLPTVGEGVELDKAFVCDFGFVMDYYPNMEFKLNDGEWQSSLVFTGLKSNTKYTITMRLAATDNSFASNTYQFEVTTK